MGRLLTPALLFLAASAGAYQAADPQARPIRIEAATLRETADIHSRDVKEGKVGADGAHDRAAGLFAEVQSKTPIAAPAWQPPDREPVDGSLGTVDKMIAEAQQRINHPDLDVHAPPPPDLAAALGKAVSMRDRMDFDREGKMADNQMGVFEYARKSLADGVIRLNRDLALMGHYFGSAFTSLTVLHELEHAVTQQKGELDPALVIAGETKATRIEYLGLMRLDPTGMRLWRRADELRDHCRDNPFDRAAAQALRYLEHLKDVWRTHGDERAIEALVKRLGYEDKPEQPEEPPVPPGSMRS